MENSEPSTQGNVKTQNEQTPRSLHTPGPRFSVKPETSNGYWYVGTSPGIDDVCVLYHQDGIAANARLIAAAPELLEALRQLRDSIGIGDEDRMIARATQVIAKAEGAPSVENGS